MNTVNPGEATGATRTDGDVAWQRLPLNKDFRVRGASFRLVPISLRAL